MPGRICKEILDGTEALKQALACMQWSVTLGHIEGQYAPYDLVKAYEIKAKEAALAAQNLASAINLGGSKASEDAIRRALDRVAPPGGEEA